MEDQEEQTIDTSAVQIKEETSPEKPPTAEEMSKISEMRHKVFVELVGTHLHNLNRIMVSNNGVSYHKKTEAAKALVEAITFALDFGLGISGATLRDDRLPLGREVHQLAGVMAQALDNKMLLLALKMKNQENQTEETKEESNG